MWVFYLIELPLTVGMVAVTLRHFAGPTMPLYILAIVGYAWLCSLSFIILIPTDIYKAGLQTGRGRELIMEGVQQLQRMMLEAHDPPVASLASTLMSIDTPVENTAQGGDMDGDSERHA